MSRRKTMILIAAVVLASVGLEVAAWMNGETRGVVEVVNDGDAPLKDLVIQFGASRIAVGDLRAGESARAWLDGDRPGAVTLAFSQAGNPLTSFSLDGVDPNQLNEEELKLVVHVRPNEVTREVEDAPSTAATPLAWLSRRVLDQVRSELSLR